MLIDESVNMSISSIKMYREFSRLKKMALVAVAVGMTDTDVDAMKTAFEEMDIKKNGVVDLDEFRQVMSKSK
jgi:Ca2+-binding EF-hand superfamily protein